MNVYRRQFYQSYTGRSANRMRSWSLTIPKPSDTIDDSTMVLIGLGSSLGSRHHHLQKGLLAMAHDSQMELVATSSVWQTMPIGAAKNAFYNMCAIIETSHAPDELMCRLLNFEKRCDRLRGVHWMDRTLDLDVLLYGDSVVDTSIIQAPHPRMLERAFVMQPAKEIAGDWTHPIIGRTLHSIAADFEPAMWKVGRFSIAHKN